MKHLITPGFNLLYCHQREEETHWRRSQENKTPTHPPRLLGTTHPKVMRDLGSSCHLEQSCHQILWKTVDCKADKILQNVLVEWSVMIRPK